MYHLQHHDGSLCIVQDLSTPQNMLEEAIHFLYYHRKWSITYIESHLIPRVNRTENLKIIREILSYEDHSCKTS